MACLSYKARVKRGQGGELQQMLTGFTPGKVWFIVHIFATAVPPESPALFFKIKSNRNEYYNGNRPCVATH